MSNVSHLVPNVDYGFLDLTIKELRALAPDEQQRHVCRVLGAITRIRALPYAERLAQMELTAVRITRAAAVIHEWSTGQHLSPSKYRALIDRQGRKRRRAASTAQVQS
jgi:hypothetical protein